MILNISAGAVLVASNDQSLYPVQDPLPSYCEARDKIAASKAHTYRAFIYAEDAMNIEVAGGGVVDGQGRVDQKHRFSAESGLQLNYQEFWTTQAKGQLWWKLPKEELPWERPRLMQFRSTKNVKLSNLGTSLKIQNFVWP